jgi:hypothetical protein
MLRNDKISSLLIKTTRRAAAGKRNAHEARKIHGRTLAWIHVVQRPLTAAHQK